MEYYNTENLRGLALGLERVSKIYRAGNEIEKIYLGDTLIYPLDDNSGSDPEYTKFAVSPLNVIYNDSILSNTFTITGVNSLEEWFYEILFTGNSSGEVFSVTALNTNSLTLTRNNSQVYGNGTIRFVRIKDGQEIIATIVVEDKNSNWQNTGNTRCVKDLYGMNTGIQESEQRDTNSLSSTYNQTRWINSGNNLEACPLPSNVAQWQDNGNYRCVKDLYGYNTGLQEKSQTDTNRYSLTYSQTRWVSNGQNLFACPLPNTNANWQDTGLVKCVTDLYNNNTGEQEKQQRDINNYSSTFNSLRWVSNGINLTVCPIPNTAANWQDTGSLRCVLNNQGDNTGEQERQQIDANSNSQSYGQIRWITNGQNMAACPIPDRSSDWQDTGVVRCVTDTNGNNTGIQQRQQKDVNPISETFNEIRWVGNGQNLTACPIVVSGSWSPNNNDSYCEIRDYFGVWEILTTDWMCEKTENQ